MADVPGYRVLRVCHVGQVKGILGLGTVPCEPAKPLKTRNPLWAGSALLTSKNAQRDKPPPPPPGSCRRQPRQPSAPPPRSGRRWSAALPVQATDVEFIRFSDGPVIAI